MVEEIERMGEIIKRPQRGTPLWHRPVRWGLLTAFNRTAL
jgi:hypothetical protein